MIATFVSISGASDHDDLINGGREAVARAGFQVGDFTLEQDLGEDGIVGVLEIDPRLAARCGLGGRGFRFEWGQITIEADAP